jgi:tetratricopeptide (TPR) repeat protein
VTPALSRAAAVVLLVAALGTAVTAQIVRDRRYPREEALERSVLYVTSPGVLRRMVLSFDALAADVYWIRALQHYGGDRLAEDKPRRYELLYPLLDLTTSLDPYFTIAYRFGAVFLSEPYPGGAGRPDQAIALLRKGIAAEPEKWQYYHDIAFVHYWQLGDMQEAARWFRRAAEQPGAPNWLESVAASMLIQGGDRASARLLLHELLRSEEVWLQRMATRSLLQIDALDAIDALQPLVTANPPGAGEPYSWHGLVRRGILPGVPVDPAGAPFSLDDETGAVTVSPESPLHPMPQRRTLS